MSNFTIRNNDEYPSIEWQEPRGARVVFLYPTGSWLSTSLLVGWVVIIRGLLIHPQLNKTPNLEAYGAEVFTDPIVWGLAVWTLFMWGQKTERAVKVGTFVCPHCGSTFHASEQLMLGAIGSRWPCSKCNNPMVKRSAPPKLEA